MTCSLGKPWFEARFATATVLPPKNIHWHMPTTLPKKTAQGLAHVTQLSDRPWSPPPQWPFPSPSCGRSPNVCKGKQTASAANLNRFLLARKAPQTLALGEMPGTEVPDASAAVPETRVAAAACRGFLSPRLITARLSSMGLPTSNSPPLALVGSGDSPPSRRPFGPHRTWVQRSEEHRLALPAGAGSRCFHHLRVCARLTQCLFSMAP